MRQAVRLEQGLWIRDGRAARRELKAGDRTENASERRPERA